jgi:hypothetical protein
MDFGLSLLQAANLKLAQPQVRFPQAQFEIGIRIIDGRTGLLRTQLCKGLQARLTLAGERTRILRRPRSDLTLF